jgi:Zn-dependent peptidase ImmA (M78 family)
MTDVRAAILRGTREAARLHRQFDMRARIEAEGGRIDVFGAIVRCGVILLFKPLDGLLGVYLSDPIPGILVTTHRPLGVQRFTGAHELGHTLLRHQPSLDDATILRRSPFAAHPDYARQELEADAFAAEFLLPRWLFAVHFRRQGWTGQSMMDPRNVYQLALRVGASYEATCWALLRHHVVGEETIQALLRVQPREIKKMLLRGYEPPNWWGDVWLLTDRDEGALIDGSRSDLFVLQLTEHSGAGYLWGFEEPNKAGFAIVRDEREGPDGTTVGGHVTRWITTRSQERQTGSLILTERQPWLPHDKPLMAFTVHYDLSGPEEEGWSQAERRRLREAA